MLQTQPFEVSDFSGGITDNYLDGPINRYKEADNFVVTFNNKLYSRPGSLIWDMANQLGPDSEQRINKIVNFDNDSDIFFFDRVNFRYLLAGTMASLVGPVDSNDAFSTASAAAKFSTSQWNGHLYITNNEFMLPMKAYKDNSDVLQIRDMGLPALASTPAIASSGGTGSNYIYAFAYFYTYQIGDVTFEDFGSVVTDSELNVGPAQTNTINITSIPVLANGATGNRDTGSIKVKVYRTQSNGDVFYYVGEVTNGTTTYNDTSSDATILTNATLYITDGSVDRDAPPLCKFLHVVNNVGYYGFLKSGADEVPNRIRLSVPNDPDSCPEAFFVEVDDDITGMGSHEYIPIIFCKNSLYRIDGRFESDGSGFAQVQKISSTTGCISNDSIVSTREGVFFAGADGFYVTNGFTVEKISREFDERYLIMAANTGSDVYGTYDKENSRVLWACKQDASSDDNDRIYSLELSFGVRPDSCFTTWSDNGNGSFSPSALEYYQGKLIRGNSDGYIFQHAAATLTDPKVTTGIDANLWETEAIIYNYVSCAFSFGSVFMRKFIPRIGVIAASETSLAMQINSINDDRVVTQALKPIVNTSSFLWGDPDVSWGDEGLIWNFTGIIEEQRRFPAKNLRCTYKQVQFTNAYVVITDSDDNTTANLDAGADTATLDDTAFSWRNDLIDYYLSFSSNAYATDHLVTSRDSATVATFQDTQSAIANTTGAGWKLKGKPKNQILNLVGYTLHVAGLGKTQKPFRSGEGE